MGLSIVGLLSKNLKVKAFPSIGIAAVIASLLAPISGFGCGGSSDLNPASCCTEHGCAAPAGAFAAKTPADCCRQMEQNKPHLAKPSNPYWSKQPLPDSALVALPVNLLDFSWESAQVLPRSSALDHPPKILSRLTFILRT